MDNKENGKFSENNIFWFVFFAVLFAAMLITVIPIWLQNRDLKQKVLVLEQQTLLLKQKNNQYEKTIKALKEDPMYIEFLLRQKQFGKKDEKVYK